MKSVTTLNTHLVPLIGASAHGVTPTTLLFLTSTFKSKLQPVPQKGQVVRTFFNPRGDSRQLRFAALGRTHGNALAARRRVLVDRLVKSCSDGGFKAAPDKLISAGDLDLYKRALPLDACLVGS